MGHEKQFGLANENQLVIMLHTNLTFPWDCEILLPLNSSGSAHLCCPIFKLPQ